MNKKTSRKRPQNPKPHKHANPDLHRAMVGLRSSSAAEPHRNKARFSRTDYRRMAQRGVYE